MGSTVSNILHDVFHLDAFYVKHKLALASARIYNIFQLILTNMVQLTVQTCDTLFNRVCFYQYFFPVSCFLLQLKF